MLRPRHDLFFFLALVAVGVALSGGAAAQSTPGWTGGPGAAAWHWRLPDAPGGLKPTQSWHATGSAPDGDIYVAGMDHVTDTALYRLHAGTLRYVGDARSASQAAHNWLPGETAQKFHTRPLWYRGKVYVATLDRSSLDDAYLLRRGFHWYAYDPARDRFADLSASEPGGSATAHGGVITLAADPARDVIYGMGAPTGEIFRYDVASGRTENLGRPPGYDRPYLYVGRVMWVDSRGRLYFSAGNPGWGAYDPAIYAHIRYFDPVSGFGERRDWTLREPRALEMRQCLPGGKRCFFADDRGHVYRFDDDGPRWSYIGQVAVSAAELHCWVFAVSADGRKAYLVGSTRLEDADPISLYEFDLATGATRRLCALADIDAAIGAFRQHTGYDAWDADGRFYFASFTPKSSENVVLTGIDPVRLKAALGLLPAVPEVSVARAAEGDGAPRFVFTRTGPVAAPLDILYKLADAEGERYDTIVIPAGAKSASLPLDGAVSVVPNGNDYVAGAQRSAR